MNPYRFQNKAGVSFHVVEQPPESRRTWSMPRVSLVVRNRIKAAVVAAVIATGFAIIAASGVRWLWNAGEGESHLPATRDESNLPLGLSPAAGRINIGTRLYERHGESIGTVKAIRDRDPASGENRPAVLIETANGFEWKAREVVRSHYFVPQQ